MIIDRNNWKEFCEEPPLTDLEVAQLRKVTRIIGKNKVLAKRIENETAETHARLMDAGKWRTNDWQDIVAEADAQRIHLRDVIGAGKLVSALEYNPCQNSTQ